MSSMREGVCPKCNSTEVYTNVENPSFNTAIRVDWRRSIVPVAYMCADCGYLEQYVVSPDERGYAVETWSRADASKKKNDE
jgi:predicted nucleic-acid-binding Zn-ribbon protein